MRGRLLPVAGAVLAVVAAAGGGVYWAGAADDRFPHARHEGLFPGGCASCHGGIVRGDPARAYTVTAGNCAGCHNGDLLDRVAWDGPADREKNLVFDHAIHVQGAEIECAACHQDPAGAGKMAVVRAAPEACLPCHEAPAHMAPEAECAVCHRPLAAAPALSAERIAAYPRPPGHEDPDFLARHDDDARARIAQCAVCHARNDCEVCHLNGPRVAAIQALERDPRVAGRAARMEPAWPAPASHRDPDWSVKHGAAAQASIETCANCHARPSCTGCHTPAERPELRSLPAGPGGVPAAASRPPGHDPGFLLEHGTAAASRSLDCQACHAPAMCEHCHQGATAPGFHPPNYMMRHAAEAYARDTDCASCHSTEVFCRDCHRAQGLSVGRSDNASFHDAQPLWLLAHGEAARQGMEACASCHQQTDCLRCHSARFGWRVSPHGPDFDAERMGDRAMIQCVLCHFGDPRE